ncbi:MAG TPA: fibronectin type III domain-containing protein [Thermoanaerobaculia bacterium]|nr:fibronectin type III domain-containing protein [Thermoanaerobaculia bacterium]
MTRKFVKKALFSAAITGLTSLSAALLPLPAGAQQAAPSSIRVIAKAPAEPAGRNAALFDLAARPDKACTVQAIQCGQTVSATLGSGDCATNTGSYADLYQFSGTLGQTVTVTERSSSFDSYLALYNPQNQDVGENNNGGGGNDAQLAFQLTSTGTWQIAATSAAPGEVGNYTLTFTCAAAPATPAAPSNLQATAVSSTEIDLSWKDNSNNETGFAIDSIINGTFQQIGTTPANTVKAQVTGLAPQIGYTFRVRALNGTVTSAPSNQVTATTPAGSGGGFLSTSAIPNFRFRVRIFNSTTPTAGTMESDCIPQTLCVSGAVAGRSEVFVRVVGPRPNGFLWPTLVRFTPSRVEVDVQQISTGAIKTYVLPAVPDTSDELNGLQDRTGFQP